MRPKRKPEAERPDRTSFERGVWANTEISNGEVITKRQRSDLQLRLKSPLEKCVVVNRPTEITPQENSATKQATDCSGSRSDDELFVEMLMKSLSKIEEGEAKEALKIEIQNLVFNTRFGANMSTHIVHQQSFNNGSYSNGNAPGRLNNDIVILQNDRKYADTTVYST